MSTQRQIERQENNELNLYDSLLPIVYRWKHCSRGPDEQRCVGGCILNFPQRLGWRDRHVTEPIALRNKRGTFSREIIRSSLSVHCQYSTKVNKYTVKCHIDRVSNVVTKFHTRQVLAIDSPVSAAVYI